MKRWQAILLNIGLAAGGVAANMIPNTMAKDLTQAAIVAAAAALAKKTSESNPDGTHASEAWTQNPLGNVLKGK